MGKAKAKQRKLFDTKEYWQQEWQNMPEFIQEDLTSHRHIIVHFRNDEDVQKFAELLGQRITPKQKSLWYPELEIRIGSDKRYINES